MGKRISFRFFFVRYLRKTPGIHKMVRIATDQSKTFSPRVIKIASQVSSMALLYRQTIVCECMSMKYCMHFFILSQVCTLGTRGFSRVRLDASESARGRQIFGQSPKSRVAGFDSNRKPRMEKSLVPRVPSLILLLHVYCLALLVIMSFLSDKRFILSQVLANLWSHSQLQQQMKSEGWQFDSTRNAELVRAPMDFEATSLPRTPDERSLRDPSRRRYDNEYVDGEPSGATDVSSESDRHRSWAESINHAPPPYPSDDSYSRGSRSREEFPMDEVLSSSRASAANSERDENDNANDRTLRLKDSGGGSGGGKNDDVWV